MESFDIIGLTETWEERTWEKIEKKIGRHIQMGLYTSKKKSGRVKGRLITAVNKELKE